MSNYTWPQKCPDLVQDVSLKRARVDDENNTSAIRTTILGVDEEHPLPVSINAVPGVDNEHPLPVLVKSDETQWFLRAGLQLNFVYYPIKWFYLSPQPLPYTISSEFNKWFTVRKISSNTSGGNGSADLTQPPVYNFTIYDSGAKFRGGWIATNPIINPAISAGIEYSLLAFKAGNTNFSSPDIEVPQGSNFLWDGEDFMDCQQHFDSTILYLQNTGGLPSDNAWNGTGDGTVISLLKGIANIF